MNLADRPRYKIEDRRAILENIYRSLFDSKDCVTHFRGMQKMSADEISNWYAREEIVKAMREL